jgi:hypothetical protein
MIVINRLTGTGEGGRITTITLFCQVFLLLSSFLSTKDFARTILIITITSYLKPKLQSTRR